MTINIKKENLHGRSLLSKAKLASGDYKFEYYLSNKNENTSSFAEIYYTVKE